MLRGLAVALVLLPLCAWTADRPKVIIAKSSNLSAYNNVVAGFSAEVKAEVEEITLPDGAAQVGKAMEEIGRKKPALVLAIGPQAAVAARRVLSDIPVVFAMVPYYEKYGLEAQNVTGIALTNDLSTELATLAAISKDTRRVGILYDPRHSKALIAQAQKAADERNLTVVPLELENPAKVGKVLAGAKGKVDALMLIADPTVANAGVVRKLIGFTLDAKLPLVGFSASQVKEGAMLSLSPSYTAVGQQAGRLANRIVHEKIDPGALAVAPPEVLDMAVNLSTAKRMGSACDLALEIFKYAARRGYPIKVLE